MLPDPLHPAVVHFPIVLAVLLPIAVLVALLAIRRGAPTRPVWAVPLALALALSVSAWVSIQTGEAQEDRVEDVVPEHAIHTHEERAELFLVLSGAVTVILAGGLLGGTLGSASRLVGTLGALLLIVPATLVGSSGGALVYEHGAAQAYVSSARGGTSGQPRPSGAEEMDEARSQRGGGTPGADDPEAER